MYSIYFIMVKKFYWLFDKISIYLVLIFGKIY